MACWDFDPNKIVLGNGGFLYINVPEYVKLKELRQSSPYVFLHTYLIDRYLYKKGCGTLNRRQYPFLRDRNPYNCRLGNIVILDRDLAIDYSQKVMGKDKSVKLNQYGASGIFKISQLQAEPKWTPDDEIDWEYDPFNADAFLVDIEESISAEEERKQEFQQSRIEAAEQTRNATGVITVTDNCVLIYEKNSSMPHVFNRAPGEVINVRVENGDFIIKRS